MTPHFPFKTGGHVAQADFESESQAGATMPDSVTVSHGSYTGWQCDTEESFRIRVLPVVEKNTLAAVGKSPEGWKKRE